MARSNFAANRVTGEGRLQQRLRFVTDILDNFTGMHSSVCAHN